MKLKDLVTPEYVAIEAAASGERALAVSKLHWWQGTQLTKAQLLEAYSVGLFSIQPGFCGICDRHYSLRVTSGLFGAHCHLCPLGTGKERCGHYTSTYQKAYSSLGDFIDDPTTVNFRAWRVAARAMYKVLNHLYPGE